jgi:hypothetical protein
MRRWTNEEAIGRWAVFPREVLDALEPDGDFSRRHLLNPALLRMLGDVRGLRILDAGCGCLTTRQKRKPRSRWASATSRPISAGSRGSADRSMPSSPTWFSWTFPTGREP